MPSVGVRVSEAHEIEGLDLSECGVEAYGRELSGLGHAEEAPGEPATSRAAHARATA